MAISHSSTINIYFLFLQAPSKLVPNPLSVLALSSPLSMATHQTRQSASLNSGGVDPCTSGAAFSRVAQTGRQGAGHGENKNRATHYFTFRQAASSLSLVPISCVGIVRRDRKPNAIVAGNNRGRPLVKCSAAGV